MVNNPNQINKSEIDSLKKGWKSLSEGALQREMGMYYSQGDYEKGDALRNFIKEQKEGVSEAENRYSNFSEQYKLMQDKVKQKRNDYKKSRSSLKSGTKAYIQSTRKEEQEVNKIMSKFFKTDMKSYVSNIKDDIDSLTQSKDSQIEDLKAQLSGIVTKGPRLSEYLSLRRRRLVSINNRIERLKNGKDKENYPKNVLIYLMALTNTSLFGTRQSFKRDRFKLTWRRKSDDIQKHLNIITNKLQIKSSDSLWTQGLKKQLNEHLLDAKQAYVDKQRRSVGLAT